MPFADYKDFADCVARNQDKSDPEAYCGSIKADAEPRAAEDGEIRHLHLRGATGRVHRVMHDGREHLVVPVIALMEGVIHAVNADTPEYVPFSTLSSNVDGWNGRPLMLNHPVRNGMHVAAASHPSVLDEQSFGKIFNTRVKGTRLLMDAYVDMSRLKALKQDDLLKRLENSEKVEVSVGAYVQTSPTAGTFNNKRYTARWTSLHPDHLAFLPDGRGACSLEMGCGAHRAASYHITDFTEGESYVKDGSESTIAVNFMLDGKNITEAIVPLLTKALARKECEMSKNGNPYEAGDGTGEISIDRILGGKGSGNFGHKGRPGQIGGSGDGGDSDGEKGGRKYQLHDVVSVKGKDYQVSGIDRSGRLSLSPLKPPQPGERWRKVDHEQRQITVHPEDVDRVHRRATEYLGRTLAGTSLEDRMRLVHDAVMAKNIPGGPEVSMNHSYPQAVFDNYVIVRGPDGKLMSYDYAIEDSKVVLSDAGTEVKLVQKYVAAAAHLHLCESCDGTGEATRPATIRKEGSQWGVYSKDGNRRLAACATLDEALQKQRAMDAALERRALELKRQ